MVGSFTGTAGTNSTTTIRLDMATNTWSTGPVWTPGRADLGIAAVGNTLYAIGGDAQGLAASSMVRLRWTNWTPARGRPEAGLCQEPLCPRFVRLTRLASSTPVAPEAKFGALAV